NKIVPGVTWDKQKSWEKIREVLTSKNKQLIMWYFATAASISILVAASMETTMPYLHKLLETETVTETMEATVLPKESSPTTAEKVIIETDRIDFKKLSVDNKLYSTRCTKKMIEDLETGKIKDRSFIEKPTNRPHGKVMVIPQINGNSVGGVSPGVSVYFRNYLKGNASKVRYISVGVSANLIYQSGREGKSANLYPATFINARYGQRKLVNNKTKEWEMGAGYLLNPNQVIYKDTTFRFHYLKTITGKLKVGPELILTNNLTRLYPGFTLAFG
ncbi:MAG: hypothetical protein WBA74_19730, partial [Cyclobacteriaceae bacterium]